MKIAIHHSAGSYSERWIPYCGEKNIPYKLVDCYRNDIVQQVEDCDIIMWHFYHAGAKDVLFAKQLLYSLKAAGKKIFPDFNTSWHFDDKVGQKYLLEAVKAPLVPAYVFYDKQQALQWASATVFPKVFKLRKGAGSVNVRLVRSLEDARALINKAFGKGFKHDSLVPFNDIYHKYKKGLLSATALVKGFARQFIPTEFAKVTGREKGYVYFQDFVPGNDSDIRVIVIGDKCFAIKRMARENDFRASGSGVIFYEKELFDKETIALSFAISKKLGTQCLAFDYIYSDGKPLIMEISFGFFMAGYDACPGYWDSALQWHEGKFNPYGWMIDNIIASA